MVQLGRNCAARTWTCAPDAAQRERGALLIRGPSSCSVPVWVPALRRIVAGEALHRVRDARRVSSRLFDSFNRTS